MLIMQTLPNSGRTSRLLSHFLTPINVTTLVADHDSVHRLYHMSYLLICERLRMVELDDYNILQHDHLVENRLS
jgi:hypothetical protein